MGHHGGREKLEERLAIRPTSESIICDFYRDWIHSYRDLPVLINQWCNVLRWEKVTRPFLRTSEFLWQEGHTVHATAEEAREETLQDARRLPGLLLRDARHPGPDRCQERLRTVRRGGRDLYVRGPDGRRARLQAATSHDLGQNFARAFDITFLDEKQERVYALPDLLGFLDPRHRRRSSWCTATTGA